MIKRIYYEDEVGALTAIKICRGGAKHNFGEAGMLLMLKTIAEEFYCTPYSVV